MNRRHFVQTAGLTAAASQRIIGANDRVVMSLVGCGGRGRYVARFMKEAPNVEFGAVADVYQTNAASAREWAGPQARAFGDFRKLLELKEIDGVLVGTPDHWHAAVAVLACRAGKHIYVEKPLAWSIQEGRAIVDAAARHKVIAQAGMQHRSSPHFAECAQIVRSGQLGEVRFVRVWNFVNLTPDGIGKEPDSDPPAGLDWDFYLGPAPKVPYNRKRFLSTYRWFSDYSGGYITDYGTHRFDTVHQIMGADTPLTVSAAGGRFTLKDAGDVPDVLQVTYEYPGFVLCYESSNINGLGMPARSAGMKYYNARGPYDRPNGMAFYGTNGTLFADRVGYEIFPEIVTRAWFSRNDAAPEQKFRMERKSVNTSDATSLHAKNFIENVRAAKKPEADVETGHRSTIVPHLGNIALKEGRKLKWDSARETFPDDPAARRRLGREPRKPWNLI
jgi:predicted dehydrogenase